MTKNVEHVKGRTLAIFGDSFVEGFIKLPERNPVEERARIRFGTVLENKYGLNVECYGKRGFGEAGISRTIWKWIKDNKLTTNDPTGGNYAVLVVWPAQWGRRHQYDNRSDEFYPLGKHYHNAPDMTTEDTVNLDWVANTSIAYTAMLLDHFNIPYRFTRSNDMKKLYADVGLEDAEVYYDNWIRQKEGYNSLLDICIGRWYNTPKENRYTRTLELCKKFLDDTTTICRHPTEKGHVMIADTLYPYLESILQE